MEEDKDKYKTKISILKEMNMELMKQNEEQVFGYRSDQSKMEEKFLIKLKELEDKYDFEKQQNSLLTEKMEVLQQELKY